MGRAGAWRSADVVDAALDGALAEPGCPLCRLVDRGLERYFDSLLWELVNDPGVRQELRASLGLCPRHWWGLVHVEQTRTHNVLGLAMLFQDVNEHIAEALGAPSSEDRSRLSRKGRRPSWRATAELVGGLARCPACKHEAWAEETYLARLIERLETTALPNSGWSLCPEHLGAAVALRGSAERPLGWWLTALPQTPAGLLPTDGAAMKLEQEAWQVLPRPRVVTPVLYGRQLLGRDDGTRCSVCSELAAGSRSADSAAPRPAGRGVTLCTVHIREVPDAADWVEVARRALAGGKVYTLRCMRCEQEAAAQAELLLKAEGPLCFPHLVERLRLERRPPSMVAAKAGGPTANAATRTTAAWAAELTTRLGGFIRKQDWSVKEPLSEPERTSVREAALFLGGRHVVLTAATGP